MYKISRELGNYELYFSPYYSDGVARALAEIGKAEFSILGYKTKYECENFLQKRKLKIDYRGGNNDYDLIVTASDLIIQKNIKDKKIILVQEGMLTPKNWQYYIVKNLKLPRYLANTSMMGESGAYQKFCVASEGFKSFFVQRGLDESKIAVTGIPNFDNVKEVYKNSSFPYENFILVACSSERESNRYENRSAFIKKAVEIANGDLLVFKLHPRENWSRARKEIKALAPQALIYETGNIEEMIAKCKLLITRHSTVVMTAAAMEKKVYSRLSEIQLKAFTPWQNGGTSAKKIAAICKEYLING